MKAFIAIPVSCEATRDFLTLCSQRLQRFSTQGSFVDQENFHITLAYIGETDRIHVLASVLDDIASHTDPFTFIGDEFGMFTRKGQATAWIGGESPELTCMHDNLIDRLAQRGFSFDKKPFHPHITLGRNVRARSPKDPSLSEMILAGSECVINVDTLTLFSSEVSHGRRIYRSVHDVPLSVV